MNSNSMSFKYYIDYSTSQLPVSDKRLYVDPNISYRLSPYPPAWKLYGVEAEPEAGNLHGLIFERSFWFRGIGLPVFPRFLALVVEKIPGHFSLFCSSLATCSSFFLQDLAPQHMYGWPSTLTCNGKAPIVRL